MHTTEAILSASIDFKPDREKRTCYYTIKYQMHVNLQNDNGSTSMYKNKKKCRNDQLKMGKQRNLEARVTKNKDSPICNHQP